MIHGAGVIEDRLIADKSPDSLARVLAVKAGSAQTLAQRLRPDSLRFLVLFSSVSGRFGNRGQADYAAASEVLAQLANELDRPGLAVSSRSTGGRGRHRHGLRGARARVRAPRRRPDRCRIGSRILADELASGRAGEAELVVGAASGLSEETAPPTATPAGNVVDQVRGGRTPSTTFAPPTGTSVRLPLLGPRHDEHA